MNFPDNTFFTLVYALINTPTIGGIVVGILATTIMLVVGTTLRWIVQGGQADEAEVYAYPTPALHHMDDESSQH